MNCPSLEDLPSPPANRTGWPWTEGSPPSPAVICNGRPWPRVTIVTPSYNQGRFIEETIRSVLLQEYPNLEYIVIDGGSTDQSVDIIRKYEPWLAYWVSEPDRGQSHAINKGWAIASGDIVAWLNSDDTYEPGAVWAVVRYLQAHPAIIMVYGDCVLINKNSREIAPFWRSSFDIKRLIQDHRWCIPQQTVFMRKSALDKAGLLDERLHYKMDRDLYIRIGLNGDIAKIDAHLANFRVHQAAKSTTRNALKAWQEFRTIRIRYGGHPFQLSDLVFWRHLVQQSLVGVMTTIPLGDAVVSATRWLRRTASLGWIG